MFEEYGHAQTMVVFLYKHRPKCRAPLGHEGVNGVPLKSVISKILAKKISNQ